MFSLRPAVEGAAPIPRCSMPCVRQGLFGRADGGVGRRGFVEDGEACCVRVLLKGKGDGLY